MTSLAKLLRSDVIHLQHLRTEQIESAGSAVVMASGPLPLPSLTVLGAQRDLHRLALTGLVYSLVREVVAEQRRVILASGLEATFRVRAECLLGRRQVRRLMAQPESVDPDDIELVGLERFGKGPMRLETYGCEEDLRSILGRADPGGRGPVSLIAVDDVQTVEALTRGSEEAVTPASLRLASRRWSSAVVVTTSWSDDDRSRWLRHADQILDVVTDEAGQAVLSGGADEVHVEEALTF